MRDSAVKPDRQDLGGGYSLAEETDFADIQAWSLL